MKGILLVRVSSTSQQLDEQTQSLIKFANEKGYSQNNLIIIEDIESAINLPEEERNGLNRMKEAIANDNDINAVFVWELSGFAG
jgi:DNA invertase Pin-like site-specific DNA recombinase